MTLLAPATVARLQQAHDSRDIAQLAAAVASLRLALTSAGPFEFTSLLKCLVVAAESALELANDGQASQQQQTSASQTPLKVAEECLQDFFGKNVKLLPQRGEGKASAAAAAAALVAGEGQYFIRAKFAYARLLAWMGCELKGEAADQRCRDAIEMVMQGINRATACERYTFLIYNGSVHFWNLARPLLQREGARASLLQQVA